MTERISSEHLTLSPLDPSDASDMVLVLSDPNLYVFTGGEPLTLPELEERYRFQTAGSPREGEIWHNWIIRRDGAAIGFVQATVIDGSADLAWVVGKVWQGSGHGTEAALAMRDWLAASGVVGFTAHIHPDHVASQTVASRLGLSPTDLVDEDGEEVWAGDRPPG
ncbi:MAG TPA: GNAT family N-acetyltransferase [Acidimicrobiia bacterium]|nr:GNAT family N-acetyltransferase [Acidimicrobiia bacterium]